MSNGTAPSLFFLFSFQHGVSRKIKMEVGEQVMSDVVISTKERSVFHEIYCPYTKRIKKANRKQISEELSVQKGYCECKFCRSVRGMVYKYRGTIGMDILYDAIDNAFCARTQVGFWKLIWRDNVEEWHVFHMNHKGYKCFDADLSSKMLMRGKFHRQDDFRSTTSISKALKYIRDHDRNYQLAEIDIRKMPKRTHEQKKRYKQQKKRKKKEAIKSLYRAFNKI